MRVNITANTDDYLDGIEKVERAMKRERRRERAWSILGYVLAIGTIGVIIYGAINMIAAAAW